MTDELAGGQSRSLSSQAYESNAALKKFYKVLSTNWDGRLEFVSTIEGKEAPARGSARSERASTSVFQLAAARDYPIYGTQWHPEKNAFEFTKGYVRHTPAAVRIGFYAAEFFVNEGRLPAWGGGRSGGGRALTCRHLCDGSQEEQARLCVGGRGGKGAHLQLQSDVRRAKGDLCAGVLFLREPLRERPGNKKGDLVRRLGKHHLAHTQAQRRGRILRQVPSRR